VENFPFAKESRSDDMAQCPALQLGVWVAFLKQPALPGEAPQTHNINQKSIKNHKLIKSSSKIYY
jgi:hypothetical protein